MVVVKIAVKKEIRSKVCSVRGIGRYAEKVVDRCECERDDFEVRCSYY
jgi:hypothetical protein